MGRHGLEEYYIMKDGKKLHYGYTTGTCAAAAAKVGAMILCREITTNKNKIEVPFMTPKGILLHLMVKVEEQLENKVVCSIKKYAGDDPDVTNGITIIVTAKKISNTMVQIEGGKGVGRVTKRGLEQAVGMAAINKVPRLMIKKVVEEVIENTEFNGGVLVLVEVPNGEEIAKKTFNPRLGIEGGISILGTSGIVVPMSEEALVTSIQIEIKVQLEEGKEYLLVTPGNYGQDFLKNHYNLCWEKNIKCSNYIGKVLEMGVNLGCKGILLVGHIGKLIKVSGGIMNTHSKEADARMELLASHALRANGSLETCKSILAAQTTDEGLEILKKENILKETIEVMMKKLEYYLNYHISNEIPVGAIVFSNQFGYLGETSKVKYVCDKIRSETKDV